MLKKGRETFKRLLALLGVVLIVALVLLTLYLGIAGSPYFMASLVATLCLPVLLYVYLWFYRLLGGREEKNPPTDEDSHR